LLYRLALPWVVIVTLSSFFKLLLSFISAEISYSSFPALYVFFETTPVTDEAFESLSSSPLIIFTLVPT